MLASTTIVMERWLRRSERLFQFRLSTLLAMTGIVGVLLAIWITFPFPVLEWGPFRIHTNFYLPRPEFSPGFPWYVSLAIIFGVGCTIYTAGSLATRVAGRTLEWLTRGRGRHREESPAAGGRESFSGRN
jgi:hypothetical protein